MIIDVVPQCDVLGYLFCIRVLKVMHAKEADEQATATYPKKKGEIGRAHV